MNEILALVKEYFHLISMAVLSAIFLWIYRGYRLRLDAMKEKEEVLRERLALKEDLSLENATNHIKKIKEYYEDNLREWYENSISQLEDEKSNAIETQQKEFEEKLNREIEKRIEIQKKYNNSSKIFEDFGKSLAPIDICGTFSVSGSNPPIFREQWGIGTKIIRKQSYYGTLDITLPTYGKTFVLKWNIESSKLKQEIYGNGFLLKNFLAAIFLESTSGRKPGYALVCYEIITPDILRGYWTGIDDSFFGTEECRRLN